MKRPTTKAPMDAEPAGEIPAFFAAIHFKGDQRLEGYSDDDIRELNTIANTPKTRSPE